MSSVEKKVCIKILDRAEIGEKKYNATMDRKDLSKLEWLKHAQEEAMDLAVYLEKLIRIEEGKEVTPESKCRECTCQPT